MRLVTVADKMIHNKGREILFLLLSSRRTRV